MLRLREERPKLELGINGGVQTLETVQDYLEKLDSVMIGRAAYQNPWLLAQCEQALHGTELPDRTEIVEQLTEYLRAQVEQGIFVKHISRHVLGLFQGLPGARIWRRFISENAHIDNSNADLLLEALDRTMQAVRAHEAIAQAS